MKSRIVYIMLFTLLFFASKIAAQTSTDQRTPEQEATKQTEILQSELNLSPEQTKQVYQINLRYEKVRQNTSSRKTALQVIRQKNEEIQQVLTQQQKGQLQNRRAVRPAGEVQNRIDELSPQTQRSLRTMQNNSRPVRTDFNQNTRSSRTNSRNSYSTRQSQDYRRPSSGTTTVRTGTTTRSSSYQMPARSSSNVRSSSNARSSSSSSSSRSRDYRE